MENAGGDFSTLHYDFRAWSGSSAGRQGWASTSLGFSAAPTPTSACLTLIYHLIRMFSVKQDFNDGSVFLVLLMAELSCELKCGMAAVEIRFTDNIHFPAGVLVSARATGDMYLVICNCQ